MNRKSIIAIASCLSVCAVVGVGFSSWLIVNNTANATADGSITVDTVEDKRITMTAEMVKNANGDAFGDGESSKIVYGAPTAAKSANDKWLIADSNAPTENLTAYVKISVTNYDQIPAKGIKVTVNANQDGYATAAAANYVGSLPTIANIPAASFTSENNGVVVQAITFTWGSHFNNENPFTYYNGKGIDDKVSGDLTYGNDAAASLDALKTALNGVTYTVTVATDTSAA